MWVLYAIFAAITYYLRIKTLHKPPTNNSNFLIFTR